MTRFKAASLVVNPYAHNAASLDVEAAARQIEQAGVAVSVVVPDSLEASTAALEAAIQSGVGVVFMGGGDGTLRQAAKELAQPPGEHDTQANRGDVGVSVRIGLIAHLHESDHRHERTQVDEPADE